MSFKSKDWDELAEKLAENECITADGFDLALVGITTGVNPVAVYDVNKMVQILVKSDGMSEEDAIEHLEFNVIGSYVGEKTPIYIDMDFMRACAFMQDPVSHSIED